MVQQTHYLPRDINHGVNSRAYWAINPTGKAIIFVHGFGGSPLDTWNQFPSLLPCEKLCCGHDVIFYGYDSLYTASRISAAILKEFLDQLFVSPLLIVNPTLPQSARRPNSFTYSRVDLVAHSLGAIVSRQALLEARYDSLSWVTSTGLILFAPAHMGADIMSLALQAFTGIPWIGKIGGAFVEYLFQSLRDLRPGSDTLRQLLDETNQALQQGNGSYLIAKKVIHGEKDKIVRPTRFGGDPGVVVFKGKNHFALCKPSASFRGPITHLVSAL